jgi:hypothetical protein
MTHSDDVLRLFESIGGAPDTYQDFAQPRPKKPAPAAAVPATAAPERERAPATPAIAASDMPAVNDALPPSRALPVLDLTAPVTFGAPGATPLQSLFARLLAVEPVQGKVSDSPLRRLRAGPGPGAA